VQVDPTHRRPSQVGRTKLTGRQAGGIPIGAPRPRARNRMAQPGARRLRRGWRFPAEKDTWAGTGGSTSSTPGVDDMSGVHRAATYLGPDRVVTNPLGPLYKRRPSRVLPLTTLSTELGAPD